MFVNLLKFEWLFVNRKKSLYIVLVFFCGMGFLMGTAARFPFPNTWQNGPYILNYIIGLASLLCIFTTTLFAAQTLFRENDAQFASILYSTPLRKTPYILSRFFIIFLVSICCYLIFIFGLFGGHLTRSGDTESFGVFRGWNYITPFLVLLLPNILFCTALSCWIGLVTKNKMILYVSGILIYFLYWGISFYTNSPLIANSAPVSSDSMRWAALLDPFGMAAFFEQTYYWTAKQRNHQLLNLSGSLLTNRIVYITFSIIMLFIAYKKFSFSTRNKSSRSRLEAQPFETIAKRYFPVPVKTWAFSFDLNCLWSSIKLECKHIWQGIPFWVICLGWIGFLSIECLSDISGNTRIPEKFATTAVMLENIRSGLPMVLLLVLVFFGSEIQWRSFSHNFDAFEKSSPVKPIVPAIAKWFALIFIMLLLIIASCICGITIQLIKNNAAIDWQLYLSLLYLIGLPAALSAGLILSIQMIVKNRYLGIAIAGLIILVTNTSLGSMFGIRHPLLMFAKTFEGRYSEMNGFARDLVGFHYKMIFWLAITLVIFILVTSVNQLRFFNRKNFITKTFAVFILTIVIATITGSYIFINTKVQSDDFVNDRNQAYEEKYGFLKNCFVPTVKKVQTRIDLFPATESFKVSGIYTLLNNNRVPIDSVYMHGSNELQWGNWNLHGGKLLSEDRDYGVYLFRMERPLLPGDSATLEFSFDYKGSWFNDHASFNTIISNGSFIRISNNFPLPGYDYDQQIDDPKERKKRNLPPDTTLMPIEGPVTEIRDLIQLDAIISTAAGQTALGIGELVNHWKLNEREFFQYKSISPIPFRFAVASAKYAVKILRHNDAAIEFYYHPSHHQNIEHIIQTTRETLDYIENHITKYPYSTLRLVEISAFTTGFAGTAYPGSLFINEKFGYQNRVDKHPEKDILNEMISHELAHQWWGIAGIKPDHREGNRLLTETLAMYTELMVYKKVYGNEWLASRVDVHKDIYLSSRSSADETPLYRMDPALIHLVYDKGMVAMYQLYYLLGEEKINQALRNFYERFSNTTQAPVSTDLLNELYLAASSENIKRIDEIFKQIIIFDISVDSAMIRKDQNEKWILYVEATIKKLSDNGKGETKPLAYDEPIVAEVQFEDMSKIRLLLSCTKNKSTGQFKLEKKPVKIVLDPDGVLLNLSDETKGKTISIEN